MRLQAAKFLDAISPSREAVRMLSQIKRGLCSPLQLAESLHPATNRLKGDTYYLCFIRFSRSRAIHLLNALKLDQLRLSYFRLMMWLEDVLQDADWNTLSVLYSGQQGENGKSDLAQRNYTDATACRGLDITSKEEVSVASLHSLVCASAQVTKHNTALVTVSVGRANYTRDGMKVFFSLC